MWKFLTRWETTPCADLGSTTSRARLPKTKEKCLADMPPEAAPLLARRQSQSSRWAQSKRLLAEGTRNHPQSLRRDQWKVDSKRGSCTIIALICQPVNYNHHLCNN